MFSFHDGLVRLWFRWQYYVGSWRARFWFAHVGANSWIHPSIVTVQPSKVWIGARVEIRQNTILDARSKHPWGIRIGSASRIKDHVAFLAYGGEIRLGFQVLVSRCSTFMGHGGIYVGDFTMIGPHVNVIASNHVATLDGRPFQEQGFTREAVYIGTNVWVGANVTILAGSHIPANSVIGAGAVVKGSLPHEGWLYVGNPARPKRRLPSNPPEDEMIYFRDWGMYR